jgi:hypothetical protein
MAVHLVNDWISGEMVGGPSGRTRTFMPRRVCATEECATVLSIYNEDLHCAVHAGSSRPDRHGVRRRRRRSYGDASLAEVH